MSVPVGITAPMLLPITGTFAPAFAAYYVLLNLRVSLNRVSTNTYIGNDTSGSSNSSKADAEAITAATNDLVINGRCHANYVENVPLALLIASFVEVNGGNRGFLAVSLVALLFFRVAHVEFGLRANRSLGWGRPVGFFGTLGFVSGMSLYAAWLVKSYWGF